jgi:hypothetical protein
MQVSFSGRELSAMGRKAPAIKADGMLGIFKRTDGAIFLGMQNANGEHEHEHGLIPVAAFAFTTAAAATEAREGALVRLASHAAPDGLLTGLSVGQAVAAIKAEASALYLEARFIRVTVAEELPAREPWTLAGLVIFIPMALIFGAILLMYIAAAFGGKP